MTLPKVALAIICKGDAKEAKSLKRCLTSAAPFVDKVFVTLTGPTNTLKDAEEVCKEFDVTVSYEQALWTADQEAVDWLKEFFGYEPKMQVGDKLFRFDVARNFNFGQIPQDYKYILWLDSDDVLMGGENLRKVVEIAESQGIEATYFNYLYQCEFAEDGTIKNVLIEHLRERLVVNTGVYKWIAPIHETLIEQKPTRKTDNYDCQVLHLATLEDRLASLDRNLKNLELSIYDTKGQDPRPIYYLAKAYFDLKTDEASQRLVPLIHQYLWGEHKSGWAEERAQACDYLAETYRRLGQLNNAVKAAHNGMIEDPQNPFLFLSLAVSSCDRGDWEQALFWVKLATQIPQKKSTLVRNPLDLQLRTLQVIYNACVNLGKVDEAWAAIVKLYDLNPEDPNIQQGMSFMQNLRGQRDLTKAYVQIAEHLAQTGEGAKIKPFLLGAPQIVAQTPFFADLQKKYNPPTHWGDDSVVIFCGPGFTNWSPKHLVRSDGAFVGGSEEAVIELSRSLAKEGWKVTVYADPGVDEGVHDGVTYLPYYQFNPNDYFNVLVSWRNLGLFDQRLFAKRTYLWNHDIQNSLEYTPERLEKITKVMFLSQWHRENVPSLPDSKVVLTSNGINT